MISPWWSIALTSIGLLGLALVFARPHSILGPLIGAGVQLLWITYAITTEQWGFIASALAYGTVNTYGILTRRKDAAERREAIAAQPRYTCGCIVGGPASCAYATGHIPDGPGVIAVHGTPKPRTVQQVAAEPTEPRDPADTFDFD